MTWPIGTYVQIRHPSNKRLSRKGKAHLTRLIKFYLGVEGGYRKERKKHYSLLLEFKERKHQPNIGHLVTTSSVLMTASIKDASEFYQTKEWKTIRSHILSKYGMKCMCCDRKYPDVHINVDHIKPVRKYWHLRLNLDNLQILCAPCNKAKGNWDETDFRPNKNNNRERKRLRRVKIGSYTTPPPQDPAMFG